MLICEPVIIMMDLEVAFRGQCARHDKKEVTEYALIRPKRKVTL